MDTIYGHSCEQMPELADESVALTVTSPPYWNAIDYDIHAADSRQYYRICTIRCSSLAAVKAAPPTFV
ncbi:MAG: hypothetical protein N3A60_11450 [Thermanaerothrix sp.]|nr:hypothetical protein [Thermanaerothrix sp.]